MYIFGYYISTCLKCRDILTYICNLQNIKMSANWLLSTQLPIRSCKYYILYIAYFRSVECFEKTLNQRFLLLKYVTVHSQWRIEDLKTGGAPGVLEVCRFFGDLWRKWEPDINEYGNIPLTPGEIR